MSTTKRIEIYARELNSMEKITHSAKQYLHLNLTSIARGKVYWLFHPDHELQMSLVNDIAVEVFTDEVTELHNLGEENYPHEYDSVLEIRFKPGVTDNPAHSAKDAISITHQEKWLDNLEVFSGELFFIQGQLSTDEIITLGKELLGNDLLNTFKVYSKAEFTQDRFNANTVPRVQMSPQKVKTYDISVSLEDLQKLSDESCWALNQQELAQIKDYYAKEEVQKRRGYLKLPEMPTDVEMEVLAQTWSEHCKHKIFASNIDYQETGEGFHKLGNQKVKSLYKSYIKKATNDIKENRKLDWLISVFSDNAGVVRFDDNLDLCIKVETHNSPSALDPYGGALTGILGVNRDILGVGVGAKPIANMDCFCFAHESLIDQGVKLPSGLKHPRRILEGVHQGVEDGGNKSGIPTVNGSITFDDQYAGKPLVFVGTVGAMPHSTTHYPDTSAKDQQNEDFIVMVGGRIGADGIHGATFSSLELNENSPATAVQIGDPLTQKKVLDFLVAARDAGIYSSVTDNGAGGLSSSVGEMAEGTGGCDMDLSLAPVKYPGLSAYELMISESQERMTFAVRPNQIEDFLSLAKDYNVEATVLGRFNNSGYLTIRYENEIVADLDMHFLHDSLLPMELKAEFDGPRDPNNKKLWHGKELRDHAPIELHKKITTILNRPNIQSKEDLVRRYDHEVQAATAVKPFTGTNSSPSDAGVIWLAPHGGNQKNAVAISNGLQPLISNYDTYTMAQYSVDEAVRNAVATGADPDHMVLLDNFCWPDPLPGKNNPDATYKMAQLVRACAGLYDTATTYGMPFVSGKDSMKNDYRGVDENGDPVKISVPPTVLVTAMGKVPNVENVMTSEFQEADQLIYHLGEHQFDELNFSEFTRTFHFSQVGVPPVVDANKNLNLYRQLFQASKKGLIQSCHDISEGGLATALIESTFGENIGIKVELPQLTDQQIDSFLFNEASGRFIVAIDKKDKEAFEKHFEGLAFSYLGKTTEKKEVEFQFANTLYHSPISDLYQAWNKEPNNEC
jgi:phosphoribosylformylglycinamidine synthase II